MQQRQSLDSASEDSRLFVLGLLVGEALAGTVAQGQSTQYVDLFERGSHTQRILQACVPPSPPLLQRQRRTFHCGQRSAGRRSWGGWLLRVLWCGLGVSSR